MANSARGGSGLDLRESRASDQLSSGLITGDLTKSAARTTCDVTVDPTKSQNKSANERLRAHGLKKSSFLYTTLTMRCRMSIWIRSWNNVIEATRTKLCHTSRLFRTKATGPSSASWLMAITQMQQFSQSQPFRCRSHLCRSLMAEQCVAV